jgi:hypothetical protein
MTAVQPQLWIDRDGAAVGFYERAFGATVLHLVGDGDDIVAGLPTLGIVVIPFGHGHDTSPLRR